MNILPLDSDNIRRSLVGRGTPAFAPRGSGSAAEVGVRPEDLRPCHSNEALVSGGINLVERLGEVSIVHVETAAGTVVAKVPGNLDLARGDPLSLRCDLERLHFFDGAGFRLDALSCRTDLATARPVAV